MTSTAGVAPPQLPERPAPARMTVRVAAAAIDLAIFVAVELAVGLLWGVVSEDGKLRTNGCAALGLMAFAPLFWLLPRRGPGKLWLGLSVWPLRQKELSFSRSLLRNVVKLIELPVLYFPSLIIAMNNTDRQSIADFAAGTIVVEKEGLDAWRGSADGDFGEWLKSMKGSSSGPEARA